MAETKRPDSQSNDRRGSSAERGYGYKWQKESKAFLAMHPLCQCPQCDEGMIRVQAASVVDHKVAPRVREAIASGDTERIERAWHLFWDRGNWQALAKTCHDAWKQRLERSGRIIGAAEDGVPLDPNHHWRRPGGV